jgi:hypothetical protein
MKCLVTSADQDFNPFHSDETIYRLSCSLRVTSWERPNSLDAYFSTTQDEKAILSSVSSLLIS